MNSRKQYRKELRKQKKETRKLYYEKKRKQVNYETNETNKCEQTERNLSIKPKNNKQNVTKKPKKNNILKNAKKMANIRQRELIEKDDKEIKRLEKKLKLNKRRKKGTIPQSYHLEGLAYILDVVNGTNIYDDNGHELTDRTDSAKQTSDDKSDNEIGNESDDELNESSDHFDDSDNASDGQTDTNQNETVIKKKPQIREDIYGHLRDSEGNLIRENTVKNSMLSKSVDVNSNLLRQIRGALNRLTVNNMLTISAQIEELFKQNSRHDIHETLWHCINSLVIDINYDSPKQLISEVSILLAILQSSVGEEVAAYIMHKSICVFDEFINKNFSADSHETVKKIDNLIFLIINLYICGIIESSLVYDIVNKLCDLFNEKTIELIMIILKNVGFILRKDDPNLLKELILRVQSLATNFDKNQLSGNRIGFILEALIAIKNNNSSKLIGYGNAVDIDVIENTLKKTVKKTKVNNIAGRYDEVLKNARFWMHTNVDIIDTEKNPLTDDCNPRIDNINERLCKVLRLNTPLRKSLFMVLSVCTDYIDASNRLILIGKKQFSEVINVILLVALNEKNFNPFYVYLFQHLSKSNRKYKLAIDFSIRDKIAELESLNKTKRHVLSNLICELLKLNVLAITCLKVIEFSDMNEDFVEFLRSILITILKEDEEIIERILSKIPNKDSFSTAIRLFISCFIDAEFRSKITNIKQLKYKSV